MRKSQKNNSKLSRFAYYKYSGIIVFLPIAGAYFTDQFISYAVVIGAVIGVGALVTMFIKKTTDYG